MHRQTWMRVARARCGASQVDAAAAVGVTRHTWRAWECGTGRPDIVQAVGLATWAGVDLAEVAAVFSAGDE